MEAKLAEIEEVHGVPSAEVLTVSDLNSHINGLFEAAPGIADVYVLGELSNCSTSSGGHVFLDLKDDESHVSCILFRDTVERLEYEPVDGDEVLVQGTAEYYGKQGRTSFKIQNILPVGEGKYYAELRKLLKKLEQEGLFEEEHKQSVPELPEKIGIVTSVESAAVQDMVNAIHTRYPDVDVYVKHAAVQGEQALKQLVEGIRFFEETFVVDVIVIGRGGGSIEDLQAFNQEQLARTIHACETPVISGVGHRTDETVTGYVADVGAITPTAAGKQAVSEKQAMRQTIERLEDRLQEKHAAFQQEKEQRKQLDLALSRERIYQTIIAVQFGIIGILLGVILL